MRNKIQQQLPIVYPFIVHEHARKLCRISDNILDQVPEASTLVYNDLIRFQPMRESSPFLKITPTSSSKIGGTLNLRSQNLFNHRNPGMFLDCIVEDGNPADCTLACKMIDRQKVVYDKLARQAAYDSGFASRENLKNIKAAGVTDVMFCKKRDLEIVDMVKSTWVYKVLRNFWAGIEGMISFL